MTAIIIRYQFHETSSCPLADLNQMLKQTFGGAIQFVAEGTILLDTLESADEVYDLVSPFFTFDDKLFVGELQHFRSQHTITRTKPSIHRIAI